MGERTFPEWLRVVGVTSSVTDLFSAISSGEKEVARLTARAEAAEARVKQLEEALAAAAREIPSTPWATEMTTELDRLRVEAAEIRVNQLEEALKPFAVIGVAHIETIPALFGYNTPFYDCPPDLVLYNDRMGHTITVGDIRQARAALAKEEGGK